MAGDLIVLTKNDWKAFENRLFKKIDEKMKGNKSTVSDVKFYSSKELENAISATRNTLQKFREKGLPFFRVDNGDYRYEKNDVLEFLNKYKYKHLANLLEDK